MKKERREREDSRKGWRSVSLPDLLYREDSRVGPTDCKPVSTRVEGAAGGGRGLEGRQGLEVLKLPKVPKLHTIGGTAVGDEVSSTGTPRPAGLKPSRTTERE